MADTEERSADVEGFTNSEADQKLLDGAKKRFERCQRWESTARNNFLNDIKFANADSYNGYQWPNNIRNDRTNESRPTLTINKTRQHNLQIVNDAKQNKTSVTIHPTGDGATYEAAQALEDLVRHVEYQSNAQAAYGQAVTFQVTAGKGFLRVVTDYCGDDSFDQEIFIRPINDPLTVYLDPDAKQADKSDGRFAFIFDDVPRDLFGEIYPQYKNAVPPLTFGTTDDWLDQDHVRVCEYFYVVEDKDSLVSFQNADGQVQIKKLSQVSKKLMKSVIDDPQTKFRSIVQTVVKWCLIVGQKVVEKNTFPSRFIPIVPVIGEETVIDGIYDCKGHTRALLDAQRMYNYWASGAVEYGALQSKSPYIAPELAIEGHEDYWNNANKQNFSVLPYNHMGDDGQEIPAPQRAAPPAQAPLFLTGMQVSQNDMMLVSGQYQSEMGAPSNERSGAAIDQRQRQGDTATYHFIDNLAIALRHVGAILIDMFPRVYDTRRVLQVRSEDGKSMPLTLDPQQEVAYRQQLNVDGEIAERALNPQVGKYEVQSDVGPSWGTKREQGFRALTQILTEAPALVNVLGDILFKSADFPLADKAAERLERLVPPAAKGTGPSMQEQQLMAHIQQLTGLLQKQTTELQDAKIKLLGKDQLRDIDAYEAETKRMAALAKAMPIDPDGLAAVVHQLVQQALQTGLGPVLQSAVADMARQAAPPAALPPPGGQDAPAGVLPQ